jgi:hypothetical protein
MKQNAFLAFKNLVGKTVREHARKRGILLTESAESLARANQALFSNKGYAPLLQDDTEYQVLMLTTIIDLEIATLNLKFLSQSNLKINKFVLITDEKLDSDQKRKISVSLKKIEFLTDAHYESFFSDLRVEINLFNPDRRNWIKQQLIKTIYVYDSNTPTLIVDSDTFILNSINFINAEKQLLLIGEGFHFPYSRHTKKFLKTNPFPFSFVHHVQLQVPQILKEIYGDNLITGLQRWLRDGRARFEFSPISEFQTYGDYLLSRYPERVALYSHIHELEDVNHFKSTQALEKKLIDKRQVDLVTLVNKHLRLK